MTTNTTDQPDNGTTELPESDAYLSKHQLAQRLNVSPRFIDKLVAKRAIPFVRFSRKLIRFPKVGVDEHLKRTLTVEARQIGGLS